MSTLVVATVKSASSAAPVFQNSSGVEKGELCKMRINFNGTGTVAIRDSFNVAGLDDNGTGSYAVNIDNDMANANYCCVSAGNAGGGAGSKSIYINSTDADHTDVMSYDNGGNQQDRDRISVAAFGD